MNLSPNLFVAGKLRDMADVLEQQQADSFRVGAYRRAARTVETLGTSIEAIVAKEGRPGVMELPGIGRGIGTAIVEMIETGRWAQLERLTGELQPEQLFRTLPGVGPHLAGRIHDELHVETLEALEAAAHDGRLAKVPGVGERRAAAIRASLAERLGRKHLRSDARHDLPVHDLLGVDAEYREKAARGALRTIAPKRFNPTGEAWLPVLHARRGDWLFTTLYSNTSKAHELGKTRDWVVIYFHREGEPESQCTVVTETRGPLTGRRVVRGREGDCTAYYAGGVGLEGNYRRNCS